jgi:FlaA1/EpsC-like NDP-sugar epimerase
MRWGKPATIAFGPRWVRQNRALVLSINAARPTTILKNSTLLITGGTGSCGHTFVPMTLARYQPRKLII